MPAIDQAAIEAAHLAGFEEARAIALRTCREGVTAASPAGNAALALVAIAMRRARPVGREPGDTLVLRNTIERVDPDETATRAHAMRGACDEPGVGTIQPEARNVG